ncbi:hypothetical protein BpHYR1_054269 [Brachionus plicatilis]|uniref:SWIM-type domain-containing protein n=1 Tax=Brachionus plicatilis TaxID=10195 RepID=A0A3M7R707_BRAPC|nr:hypothetical protein BpHYR1_054269 [Brachionus plicatilis]
MSNIFHVLALLLIFADINKFEYLNIKFDYSLKRDNSMIVKADKLILSDFSMIDSLSAYGIVNNENKYYVLLKPPYCSCLYFLEFGICKHFICLCKLLNYYSDDNVREFVCVKKKVDQLNQTMPYSIKYYPLKNKRDSNKTKRLSKYNLLNAQNAILNGIDEDERLDDQLLNDSDDSYCLLTRISPKQVAALFEPRIILIKRRWLRLSESKMSDQKKIVRKKKSNEDEYKKNI